MQGLTNQVAKTRTPHDAHMREARTTKMFNTYSVPTPPLPWPAWRMCKGRFVWERTCYSHLDERPSPVDHWGIGKGPLHHLIFAISRPPQTTLFVPMRRTKRRLPTRYVLWEASSKQVNGFLLVKIRSASIKKYYTFQPPRSGQASAMTVRRRQIPHPSSGNAACMAAERLPVHLSLTKISMASGISMSRISILNVVEIPELTSNPHHHQPNRKCNRLKSLKRSRGPMSLAEARVTTPCY
ncbi:hypothetical protein GGR51DRAFT_285933 [Nemania sp. FL0031]|nr:hypothetical protein GGR51DRAFT_285933 [Nemania sp. FL0031]